MTRWYETGLHSFYDKVVWDRTASNFFDKIVWDRTAFVFMTRWHETGLHSFLWQDCMRQDCTHFYDKIVWDRTAFIFMTRLYETGTHPFYIGMYIHIYTHIYTSQKECLCIFSQCTDFTKCTEASCQEQHSKSGTQMKKSPGSHRPSSGRWFPAASQSPSRAHSRTTCISNSYAWPWLCCWATSKLQREP